MITKISLYLLDEAISKSQLCFATYVPVTRYHAKQYDKLNDVRQSFHWRQR
ncbi:MAG: hypothetical protein ILA03_06920 [Bacteroidaceae bacterium]|nr:hypothetical protein [Bacteroidaceae bacterium]